MMVTGQRAKVLSPGNLQDSTSERNVDGPFSPGNHVLQRNRSILIVSGPVSVIKLRGMRE